MAGKNDRPKARLAKGFRDIGATEIRGLRRMLGILEDVSERYGFDPVEQPFIEYTDALGKFLPDADRPGEGVFSFTDDDKQWLSLRYDLTAPLARFVAENYDTLPRPYRSYRQGWVFRNEKPGLGRYRQFMQFDVDTVGAASPAADAEVCMMAADALEALGIGRGDYVIKLGSRKVLDGVLEKIGISGSEHEAKRLIVMRAIDKRDRLGVSGVRQLLGKGRKDDSGDFTEGADLRPAQIDSIVNFVSPEQASDGLTSVASASHDLADEEIIRFKGLEHFHDSNATLDSWARQVGDSQSGWEGVEDLRQMIHLFRAAGFGTKRIIVTSEVVRGLAYYTGPVFEAELLLETHGEGGQLTRFGSVGGGGRYDDLVARFRGEPVPATGISIGVSRLYSALSHVGKLDSAAAPGPVVVTVMDRSRLAHYQRLVARLRDGGIRAELYLGAAGLKAQMKYADRRGAALAVIQGEDERARGEVQIKDLREGARLAESIGDRDTWLGSTPAQVSVPESKLVDWVRDWFRRRG
jgi:histidyl-tRNA synthetase